MLKSNLRLTLKIFRLYHTVTFAALVILTFLPTNLQAQSSPTDSAPTRPISDAQFKKILADAQTNGKDHPTNSEATTAFGITHQGETLTLRQDSFRDTEHNRHTLTILNNGNYLFALRNAQFDRVHIYYVDKNLVLISALVSTTEVEISIVPNKDAQAGLDAELKYFAGIADQL